MTCNIPTSINAATASIHFYSVLAYNMHKIARVEPTSCEKSLWDKTPPSQVSALLLYGSKTNVSGDETSILERGQ